MVRCILIYVCEYKHYKKWVSVSVCMYLNVVKLEDGSNVWESDKIRFR